MSRVLLRWLPAVIIPLLIAGGTLVAHAATDATPPHKTPQQVLALAAADTVTVFSGTVQQTSALGLPAVPNTGAAAQAAAGASAADTAAASALQLLTGSHTARIYADGPRKQRVQLMETLAERDLVHNGNRLWLYDSKAATATELSLPTSSAARTATPTGTPAQLAHRLLTTMSPSTAVSLDADTTVAGHPAYDLVLTPRTASTLIGSVSIAVDATTGFPLRVAVTARGANSPAFAIAFTSLSYQAPDASLFAFSPPSGTTITRRTLPAMTRPHSPAPGVAPATPSETGSGWARVLQLPAGSVPATALDTPLLTNLTTPVAGGRVLSTALLNVLIGSDGRVIAGSVPVSALQAAAAG